MRERWEPQWSKRGCHGSSRGLRTGWQPHPQLRHGPLHCDEPRSGGEHGVYLTYTTGARITNNYIYDNYVRGLQLYPKAEGTLVEHNVLDGNSQNVNIGSYQSAGHFSRDTTVKNNIITNSALQHPDDKAQIHGFYPAGTSDTKYNNTISENCIYQQDPTKNFSGIGYTQTNNIFSDPLYKDRAAKNFALQDGSPCAGKGPQTFVQPPGPNTRPSIIILSPAPLSETTNRRPTISATVRDAETDLQKSHVKIYIDDKLILDNHYGYRPADDYLWREFEREDPDFAYGTHTARVVATDPQGLSTEKSWSFKVVPPNTIAPNTTITSGPSGTVRTTTASFSFSSSEAGSRFQCSLDRGAFTACSSPKSYTGLANGSHTFLVRAIDAAGNVDASPAVRSWSVDTIKPRISAMSPRHRSITGDRTPTIKAVVKDNTNLGKGNIKLYVAGKRITRFSYSASTDRLLYNSPRLSRGKKVVKIVARDAAGNPGVRSWYFTIK